MSGAIDNPSIINYIGHLLNVQGFLVVNCFFNNKSYLPFQQGFFLIVENSGFYICNCFHFDNQRNKLVLCPSKKIFLTDWGRFLKICKFKFKMCKCKWSCFFSKSINCNFSKYIKQKERTFKGYKEELHFNRQIMH